MVEEREDPVAVEFDLGKPTLCFRRRIRDRGQLRRQLVRQFAFHHAGNAQRPGPLPLAGCRYGRLQGFGVGARLFVSVVPLDQQPIVLLAALVGLRLQPHQGEFAVQPLAGQDKLDLTVPEFVVRVDKSFPGTAIPGFHRPGAVMSVRDRALEVSIVQRMILDMDGNSLVRGIHGGAFAHRPAPQHVIVLQAEIPVQPGPMRLMLLHDEDRRFGLALARSGRGLG